MVCGNNFQSKYARFLIKYHLFIFCWIFIMTSICFILLIYKRDRIHVDNILKGFQAHGTKSSDDYRKLVALIRESQATHFFPLSSYTEKFQQTPYPSFNPHINPCSKRFYLPTCPILNYTELTFNLKSNTATLFDDIDTFKSVCEFEWVLRMKFKTCPLIINGTYCQFIGPVGLLFDEKFDAIEQCHNVTLNQLETYRSLWTSCNSSTCPNAHLHHYVEYLQSSSMFKIYINIENNTENLIDLYKSLYNKEYEQKFQLIQVNFDLNSELILFNYLIQINLPLLGLTISLYVLFLLLFVKNIFFVVIIIVHIFITILSSLLIYVYLLQLPLVILNCASIILYLFIIFIDSFLWYTCWFVNNHRRDDCTMHRMMKNLLTQTFYYSVPKNLVAIITLVITYTNQIIVLQCFTVFSFLLISISFFVSFTLYPVSFVVILRHQSTIPTIEHCLHHALTKISNLCFIDRTITYLIIKFKAFWLTLFIIISSIAFIIVIHRPKLEFNACRITFDTLPLNTCNEKSMIMPKTLDIDVTYYIGSHWEVSSEFLIPTNDIPILYYITENKMTSTPGTSNNFQHNLAANLRSLINFCSELKLLQTTDYINKEKELFYKYNYQQNGPTLLENDLIYRSSTLYKINEIRCFGDLSPTYSNYLMSNTKYFSIIQYHENQSINCNSQCYSNKTSVSHDCIQCLNSLYYNSNKYNDLFLIKNGLRYINDGQDSRYLLQTVNYKWSILTSLNNISEWKLFYENLQTNFFQKFYANNFSPMSFWWSSEIFSTYSIMEQLQQEKHLLTGIKFLIILITLVLFTGILGLFVTLTTLFNFVTCIALLTLFNYKLTIENASHFVIVLVICSQYSVLYSISYKLSPTFFFQRQNRTMYSLKQLCTTLFYLTLSIIIISIPCLLSSLPYLSKSAMILITSSSISLLFSTFFLQSLLYYMGPAGPACSLIPCRLTFMCNSSVETKSGNDLSLRNSSNKNRRHQRMSTSSHAPSSHFSQMFTGSTYFESEFSGVHESLALSSRRRESSRSYQLSHIVKRNSALTGEIIELYTPRASLAPYGNRRYSRHSSVPRGVPTTGLARPLYVSTCARASIHSTGHSRRCSPSSNVCQQSRSSSPHSKSIRQSPIPRATSLRPCYSAPRLHAPHQRFQTINTKQTDSCMEENSRMSSVKVRERPSMNLQRQDAIKTIDDTNEISVLPDRNLSAAIKRTRLKGTTIESANHSWLKRSSSS